MSLPESIPVRYTEEEAGYVTVRPIVRQTFRLYELLDMILSVTGKEAPRIRKILRSGTVVYHFYRYWWEGFDAGEADLAAALAQFPDAAPSRPFSPAECQLAIFESGGAHPRSLLELERANGSHRRMFRKQSFWERLLEIADRGEVHDTRLWTAIAAAVGAYGNTTALVGTPEQVTESLMAYYDIGVTTFLIRGFEPLPDAIEYGRELIPMVRAAAARHDRTPAPAR